MKCIGISALIALLTLHGAVSQPQKNQGHSIDVPASQEVRLGQLISSPMSRRVRASEDMPDPQDVYNRLMKNVGNIPDIKVEPRNNQDVNKINFVLFTVGFVCFFFNVIVL